MEKTTRPVYTFENYKLVSFNFSHRGDQEFTLLKTKVNSFHFDKEKSIFSLEIILEITFGKDEKSNALFTADYLINDIRWLNAFAEKKEVLPIFFSCVFPFIREKIAAITGDSRMPILIPVLDLRQAEVTEWLSVEAVV